MQANQSIVRAVELLRHISDGEVQPSVRSLAGAVGVSEATGSRMLGTLEQEGLVERLPGRRFRLGAELARLGRMADRTTLLVERIEPFLQQLSRECRETVTLSVRAPDGQLDVVRQIHGPHFIGDHNWVGLRPPNHATSNGKVFLAEMSDEQLELELQRPLERFTEATIASAEALRDELSMVRFRGYATLINELEDGLSGISVPLHDADGSLIAIMTLSGPSYRFDEDARNRALAALRATAEAIRDASAVTGRPTRSE